MVNALGAFGLAFVASRGLPEFAPWVYQGVTVGFLGSYTTFSAIALITTSEWGVIGIGYLVLTLVIGCRDGSGGTLARSRFSEGGNHMTPLALLATVSLGALGALLRWWISQQLPSAPWWSLGIVNVTGSAGIGVVAALPESVWTYPLMVGLAGALTTFSTLALVMTPAQPRSSPSRSSCLSPLTWCWEFSPVLQDLPVFRLSSESRSHKALRDKLRAISRPESDFSGRGALVERSKGVTHGSRSAKSKAHQSGA